MFDSKFMKRMIVHTAIYFIALFLIIFIMAGRFDYWQGWLYFVTTILLTVASIIALKNKPELLKERMKPGKGAKWWDKIFFGLFIPLYVLLFVVSVLDAGRFFWSPLLSPWLYVLCYILYIEGFIFVLWAMRANQFFSSVVRIQKDRGHVVIQSGPYQYIRHPGYVGIILIMLCLPIMLGSLWGIIPAILLNTVLIVRTALEDRVLQNELDGYQEYASKVIYRLIPGVW